MNIRPIKKPLLEEADEIPTTSRQTDIEWFQKSLEKSPGDIGLRFGKARLHMQRDEWESGKKELLFIIEKDSDQAQAWDLLLVVSKMVGDQTTLVRCYENLGRLRKWDDKVITEHGQILLNLGRYEDAKERFDFVLEMDDGNADAWAGRSEAIRQIETMAELPHEELGSLDSSKKEQMVEGYDKALEIEPNNVNALHGRTEVSLREKQWDEARTYAERAISVAPTDAVSWEQKARALEMQGDSERAMAAYQRAVQCPEKKEEKMNPEFLLSKARAMEKVGDEESSIRCLEKIIDIDRENQRALMKKAEILETLGKHQEAASTLDELVNLRPRDHYLWYLKGNNENASSQYSKAVNSLDRSLSEKPDFSPAMVSKGDTLFKMGRLDEGAQVVSDLLSIDPGNTEGLKLRSAIHSTMEQNGMSVPLPKDSQAAPQPQTMRPPPMPAGSIGQVPTISRSLSVNEESHNARADARGLIERGLSNEAIAMLESEYDPNSCDVEYIDMMGDCYINEGRYDDAVSVYKEAMKVDPGRSELYTSAARAHFQKGDLQGALQMVRSCPEKAQSTDMVRAEIEIEAEMLSRTIKERFGVLNKRKPAQNPSSENTPNNLTKSKDYMDALNQKIESIISENPDDHLLWYTRAMLLYEMKDIKGAIKAIEKALWIEPNSKKYWETKGELYALVNKEGKSKDCFERADCLEDISSNVVAVAATDFARARIQNTVEPVKEELLNDIPLSNGEEFGEMLLADMALEAVTDMDFLLDEVGDWSAELLAEWKQPDDEGSFKCPECNSAMNVSDEKCGFCGSAFKWDFSICQPEQFLTDLLFFDCMKEEFQRDMLASAVFRFEEGKIITVSAKNGEGEHIVREWIPGVEETPSY